MGQGCGFGIGGCSNALPASPEEEPQMGKVHAWGMVEATSGGYGPEAAKIP